MLAQKGLQRPHGKLNVPTCHIRNMRRGGVVVRARERSGPSGIHIEGNSPTSPKGWQIMREALINSGVKIVSPQEVVFAAERGAVIVDVRPEGDYDEGHVPGAANVPFYQPISGWSQSVYVLGDFIPNFIPEHATRGWSPFQIARRVGYAMFGVLNGTEVNPEFSADVQQLINDPEKGVILYCSQGGVLEANENYRKGWQTRSLVAAYDLLQEGVTNISIMKGGYSEWVNSGRDIEVMEVVEESAGAEMQQN